MFREKNITVTGLEKAKDYRIKTGNFVNPKNKIEDTAFINVSSYSSKVELDLLILNNLAQEYLPQISYNINMPLEELKNLLNNYDSEKLKRRDNLIKELSNKKSFLLEKIESLGGTEVLSENDSIIKYLKVIEKREHMLLNNSFNAGTGPVIFRVSIPFWRLHENCYCGDLYVSKEDFLKGVLIFNKSFGKFHINVLPEHRFLLENYYNKFIKMLKSIDMDENDFNYVCPLKNNKSQKIGHFCTVCIKNKKRLNQRNLIKAIKQYKYLKCDIATNYPLKLTNKKIIRIKKAI